MTRSFNNKLLTLIKLTGLIIKIVQGLVMRNINNKNDYLNYINVF